MTWLTLAQANPPPAQRPDRDEYLRQMSDHFSGSGLFNATSALIAIGLLLTVAGLWVAWRRRQTRERRSHPAAVFKTIANQLGLGAVDRWRLRRIAKAESLPTPLTLLLSPATLTHHTRAYAAKAGAGQSRQWIQWADRLNKRLFSKSDPAG